MFLAIKLVHVTLKIPSHILIVGKLSGVAFANASRLPGTASPAIKSYSTSFPLPVPAFFARVSTIVPIARRPLR